LPFSLLILFLPPRKAMETKHSSSQIQVIETRISPPKSQW
jgi:hypothetical protein